VVEKFTTKILQELCYKVLNYKSYYEVIGVGSLQILYNGLKKYYCDIRLITIGEIKLNKFFSISALVIGLITVNFSENVLGANIEAGEQIFNANCAACHAGGNNAIITEKTLKKDVLAANAMNNIDAITTQVTNGKGAMPAFGSRLEAEDIENVANYVLNQSEKGW
jgi:cytochrome c6